MTFAFSRLAAVVLAAAALAAASCSKPPPPPPVPTDKPAATEATKLPATLGIVVSPPDNVPSPAKVALGHQLFFDKRLSADGSRACYTCHQNEDGNGGHEALAIGANGKQLTRHSPVIWNVGYLSAFYADGRAPSLKAQATGAWSGGNMGVGKEGLEAKAKEIEAIPGYKTAFDAVFPGEGVTVTTIVKAIAAYERTLICDNTAYDRHAKGDASAFTDSQRRGQDLFLGKAGCIACHAPPFFSAAYAAKDGVYFNIGIGTKDKAEADVDIGRMEVSKNATDWAAFKVPTLRHVSKSAPYFHDGSVATLEAAVRLMAGGGIPNKNLTPLMMDKKLTDPEIADIVAFLGGLDCEKTLEQPTLP